YGLPGPAEEWARLRDQLREEILSQGVDAETGSFTQTYDNTEVDASLLQIPQTGFVGYDDPRMLATVERLEQELMYHGLLLRYRTVGTDGLAGDEHPFLACSFWLVEQYARTGRVAEATALMDTLVSYTNHLGLLAEEYDPASRALCSLYTPARGNRVQDLTDLPAEARQSVRRAPHALEFPDHHNHLLPVQPHADFLAAVPTRPAIAAVQGRKRGARGADF